MDDKLRKPYIKPFVRSAYEKMPLRDIPIIQPNPNAEAKDKLWEITKLIPGILLALQNAKQEIRDLPLFVPILGSDRHSPAIQCIDQAIDDLKYCQEVAEETP